MGFLTFIFFLLLGFYIFGLIVKVLFRSWINRKARQFQQGGATYRTYTWGAGGRGARPQEKREGEVTVQQPAAAQSKRVNKSVGEYVEFEEVEIVEETIRED